MIKQHCDICDGVIPATEAYRTVNFGRGTNSNINIGYEPMVICKHCWKKMYDFIKPEGDKIDTSNRTKISEDAITNILSDLTDGIVHYQLANLGIVRCVAIVEGYAEASTCTLYAIDDFLTFISINSHRLLGHYVAAHLHRLNDILMMSAVDGGYDDYIGLCFLYHFFKLICFVSGQLFVAKLGF